jgi:choline kinase
MKENITYAIIACNIDKGMKSKGSKGLIEINNRKIFDYQINNIILANKNKPINYEIIIITSFEKEKTEKYLSNRAAVYSPKKNKNTIISACEIAKYDNIFFIDYGCLYSVSFINKFATIKKPFIVISKDKKNKLEISVSCNQHFVENMFFDLSNKLFTNIFLLNQRQKSIIVNNKQLHRKNLLEFEILNTLIDSGEVIGYFQANNDEYLYFNNMRQKNEISRFFKKNK